MSGAAEEPAVLTVEQLAARWHVNAKTVYAAIQAGQISVLRLGRAIRVPIAVVRSLESQDRVGPEKDFHVRPTR